MSASPDKAAVETAARRDHVGAWLVTSAMIALLLLQAVASRVSCCIPGEPNSGALLTALSTLASGI